MIFSTVGSAIVLTGVDSSGATELSIHTEIVDTSWYIVATGASSSAEAAVIRGKYDELSITASKRRPSAFIVPTSASSDFRPSPFFGSRSPFSCTTDL